MSEESEDEVILSLTHKKGLEGDLAEFISGLLYSNLYSDITVLCQGRTYFCHKVTNKTRTYLGKIFKS